MLNSVILIGRLTRDPELRYTNTGHAVTGFGLAVERDYKSSDGNKETDFFNIVCWNRLAETTAQHLIKGRLVAVQGRLQSRTVDKDGQRRTYVEVVANTVKFLDYAKEQQDDGYKSEQRDYGGYRDTYSSMVTSDDDDSDLPF